VDAEFTGLPVMSRPYQRPVHRVLSTVELLVVIAILASIASMAAIAYQGYIKSIKTKLSTTQKLTIEERVITDFDLIVNGVDAGLLLPGTSQPITSMSTCRDFLDATRERLATYNNPFDNSPAVTFWSGYSNEQKKGKFRITCFRFYVADIDNGGTCRMRDAGIRITYYRIDCGGVCGTPHCIYTNADCGGATGGGWVHNAQAETFHGKVEHKYVMLPDGRRARWPNGDLMVDPVNSRQVCPGYNFGSIPREADY
jgi:type II secretory pathway pseudopilin PulG